MPEGAPEQATSRSAEMSIAMECRLIRIVEHGSGSLRANYVIGEVVYFHIQEPLMQGNRVDSTAIDAIGRLGGANYTRVTKESVFSLERPASPIRK